MEAGLPLVTALEVMGEELDHAPSRELLRQLRTRVQEGASLSEAMADHPRVFSIMYVRLVRVGETGGILDSGACPVGRNARPADRASRAGQDRLGLPGDRASAGQSCR